MTLLGKMDFDVGCASAKLFAGQYYDSETGLHYNYFRDYDPATGRYVQSDPIGLVGGLNTYGYVGGNPLSYIDPYGLSAGGLAGTGIAYICSRNPKACVSGLVAVCQILGGCKFPEGMMNEDASDDSNVIPLPGAKAPPEQCDDEEKDKGCEALRASQRSSCAGLKGKARLKCFFMAEANYKDCRNEK